MLAENSKNKEFSVFFLYTVMFNKKEKKRKEGEVALTKFTVHKSPHAHG